MYNEPWPFPPQLPAVSASWLDLNGGLARKMATAIRKTKKWPALPKLADMLALNGCPDVLLLRHLCGWTPCNCKESKRQNCYWCKGTNWKHLVHKGHYKNGCWQRECWALNHLLGEEQPLVATWQRHGEEMRAAVINPGEWYGKTWLIYVEDCFSPPLYIVESDIGDDVESVFIDSDWGVAERLDPDDEWDNKDYGFSVRAGDQIGNVLCDEDGCLDLQGNYVKEKRTEPQMTDGGTLYDGDNIRVVGHDVGRRCKEMPFPCLYHGPGLPPEGISPLRYALKTTCRECDVLFYPPVHEGLNRYYDDDYCQQHQERD